MRKQQAGFTLIELIMVIVILGILSAFALPRFADLGGEARAAAVQGAGGSVRSAAAIAHSLWLAEGDSTSTEVTLEGVDITMVNGYPAASAVGILAAAQITTDDYDVTAGNPITIDGKGATTAANCRVSYTAAAAANASPTITTVTTGC